MSFLYYRKLFSIALFCYLNLTISFFFFSNSAIAGNECGLIDPNIAAGSSAIIICDGVDTIGNEAGEVNIVPTSEGGADLFLNTGGIKYNLANDLANDGFLDNIDVELQASGITISTINNNRDGLQIQNDTGDIFINWDGSITTLGDDSTGIGLLIPFSANNNTDTTLTLIQDGTINTSGDGSRGIRIRNGGFTPPGVGIFFPLGYDALADNAEFTTNLIVNGDVTSTGDIGGSENTPSDAVSVSTVSFYPGTLVSANERGTFNDINVTINGSARAFGEGANGVDIQSINVWGGNVFNGNPWKCGVPFPTGVCGGSGSGDITVAINGDVFGGWGETTTTKIASGLFIDEFQNTDGISITIGPDGTLGALSDIAFDTSGNAFPDNGFPGVSDPITLTTGDSGFETKALVFTNNGVINGSGFFGYNSIVSTQVLAHIAANNGTDGSGEGARPDLPVDGFIDANTVIERGDVLINNGRFNFSRYSDEDGDGTRDLERIAVLDFDNAVITSFENLSLTTPVPINNIKDSKDVFNNNGDLALLTIKGAANGVDTKTAGLVPSNGDFVSTSAYVPAGYNTSFHNIALQGVEQGHIRDLETFTHSGRIILQDALTGGDRPVAGDILVITGNDAIGSFDDDNGGPQVIGGGKGVFQSNGGQLLLDTVYNKGSFGVSRSDILVVDSTTTMTPVAILIAKAGGLGASTDINKNGKNDKDEGILLVEVLDNTASSNTAFQLAGDFVTKSGEQAVIDGAFAYTLEHEILNGNWYLRSLNRLQPAAPIYEAYGASLHDINRHNLPTLQQRVGNRFWQKTAIQSPPSAPCDRSHLFSQQERLQSECQHFLPATNNAVWGRLIASHSHVKPDSSTSGLDYETTHWQFHSGIDMLVSDQEDGKLFIGVNVSYRDNSVDIQSLFGDGDIDTDGWGVGITATWYEENGFYADGQVHLSWLNSDLNSDSLGSIVDDNSGQTHAASLELGWRLALDDQVTLTPQAQLYYSQVDFSRFAGPFGEDVQIGDDDQWRLRLGLAYDWETKWRDDEGNDYRRHIYTITNLHYLFDSKTDVRVADTKLRTELVDWLGEIGVGGSLDWNQGNASFYGEVSYRASLADPSDTYDLGGKVGLRFNF